MINWYYGGSISQDRISYYLLGSGPPENDLGHGRGLYPSETNNGLSWALDGASIYNPGGKPSFDQIKTWIDANRPILRRNTAGDWHATVIDGYEENGDQLVHVIDPWTGTENIPAYADLPIYEVWVPPTVATARSDEATLTQDSDDDGIVDFDEINRFGTDPNKVDSDEDGVPDKSEIAYYTFTTRKPDPDGDGIRMELDPNEGPPDATIAAGSDNGYVYVYNKTGSLLWSYYTGADVASVAVSSDGAYIGVGSLGNKLYLFSRGGTKLWEQPVPIAYGGAGRGEESKSVAISAYGEYVVAGGTDKLYLYKKGGTLHWSHAGQETCVGISPNANYIVSCNKDDGTIDFFSSANSDPLWSKSIGAFWVATSDPGYVIASSSNKVYFFDNAGTEVWNYPLERGDLVRVDMPQDGLPAVTVNDDSGNMACYLWCFDLTGLDWKFTPCPPEHDFYSLAISADGNVISMGPGPMGGIYMFSRDGVSLQNITIGTFMDIHSVDLTSNGEFGACGDRDGKLWYFSKHSSTPLWSKTIGGNVHTVALATFGPPEAGGVGGVLVPIDKLGLLSPYIISTLAIVVTATVSAIYNKYKFKRRTRSNNLSNPPFI